MRLSFASKLRCALYLACASVGPQTSLAQSGPQATPPTSLLAPKPASAAAQINELLRAGKPAEALSRADAVLAAQPRDAQARFLRGVAFSDLGRADEAIAVFEALVADFPELPEPYNNLAVLIAAKGQLEPARALLHQAIAAQPNYLTAFENLGELNLALAADALERAARLEPNNARLQARLATVKQAGLQLKATR